MGGTGMRRCRKIQKDMDRYLDGELPPERIHAFEDHLRTCARCRRLLELKREQRRMRVASLIPAEIPLSTEEILHRIQEKWPLEQPAEILPFPVSAPWWKKLKVLTLHPIPVAALALCLIALGLTLFLPFGSHKMPTSGVVVEKIETTQSVMIYQPERVGPTVIWIVPGIKESPRPSAQTHTGLLHVPGIKISSREEAHGHWLHA